MTQITPLGRESENLRSALLICLRGTRGWICRQRGEGQGACPQAAPLTRHYSFHWRLPLHTFLLTWSPLLIQFWASPERKQTIMQTWAKLGCNCVPDHRPSGIILRPENSFHSWPNHISNCPPVGMNLLEWRILKQLLLPGTHVFQQVWASWTSPPTVSNHPLLPNPSYCPLWGEKHLLWLVKRTYDFS